MINAQTEIEQPPEIDQDAKQIVHMAQTWLGDLGILSDWHKNCIIIDLISCSKHVRNVELLFDPNKKLIDCIIIVGWWTKLFKSRRNLIVDHASRVFGQYVPKFNVNLRFKYGKS